MPDKYAPPADPSHFTQVYPPEDMIKHWRELGGEDALDAADVLEDAMQSGKLISFRREGQLTVFTIMNRPQPRRQYHDMQTYEPIPPAE